MRQYYIHNGQNEKGPLSLEELKLEPMKRDSPIWYEGLESWTTAGEVDELKNIFSQKVSPPPLKNNYSEISAEYPRNTSVPYSDPLANQPISKSNSFRSILIILVLIIGISLIGWLIYDNKGQKNAVSEIRQQMTQQQEAQQQKEQQQLLDSQNKQAEKDNINAKVTEKYMGYRNNWRNYFIATHNQYTSSLAGGISNLSVEVYNRTDKIVDEVQVRVDYVKDNGGIYKSETVSITNISPSSSKSVIAPESGRGTSVKLEIIDIAAKSFHFCYPSGMPGNKDLDPYFCK